MLRQALVLTALLSGGALIALSAPSGAQEDGWISLLDPMSLDNWDRTGDANWRLTDGIAEADMGFGHLVTRESYGDFELRAEFWVDDPANSGIFLRCQDPAEPSPRSCYEVNIYDERPDPAYGTGGIPNHAAVENVPKIGGQWNTYEITAQGDHLVLVLNGLETVNVRDGTYANGPITLQYGGGTVRFRKVEIRPL